VKIVGLFLISLICFSWSVNCLVGKKPSQKELHKEEMLRILEREHFIIKKTKTKDLSQNF